MGYLGGFEEPQVCLAHVGGFIFGALTARFFEDPRRVALQPPRD